MKLINKILLFMVTAYSLFLSFFIISSAIENTDIYVSDSLQIPEEINLEIKDECIGHQSFIAADANDNGDFIIQSRIDNKILNNDKNTSLHSYYIDVFNSDGKFLCEISVERKIYGIVSVINDRTVYIFFSDNVLLYNIDTKSVSYHSVLAPGEWQKYQMKENHSFSVGEWEYTCVPAFEGVYKELVRTNNITEEVVFSITDDYEFTKQFLLRFIPIMLLIIVIMSYRKRRSGKPIMGL